MTPASRQDAARPSPALEESETSPAFIARVMSWMFLATGVLSCGVFVFPRPPEVYEPGFVAAGIGALICALIAHLVDAERHPRVLTVLAAIGVALISAAIWAGPERLGGPAPDIEMLYLWPALFAAYCLEWRGRILQILWIGACYLTVQILVAPSDMVLTRWLQTMTTVAGAVFLVSTLRDRVASLVERLWEASRTDPLTGLQNRRGFEEEIEREIDRARRNDGHVAVVVGDLDNFKRLNDRYGHGAGDAALRRVGQVLSEGKRKIDTVARTGGEEFALLLPETEKRGAYVLAERLRVEISLQFTKEPQLTISFGVAGYPDHALTAEELLTASDRALYAAKQLGRDRSVLFSDQLGPVLAAPDGEDTASSAAHLNTVISLAEALDLRDTGTSDHSETVGRLSAMTARELNLAPNRVERIRIAGVLHDIGKVSVPDAVLRKAGPLDEDEWQEMRRHPEIGAHILGNPIFDDLRSWVLAHHERPDGRGYPYRLSGSEIPLEARILAVADAYEAMTADRVYRPAMSGEAARAELMEGAGTQFDARIVEVFIAALDRAVTRVGRAD